MKIEEWLDIPGYIGLYRASTFGNIYSYKNNKILSSWINNRGYYCLHLYKNGKRTEYKVHTLINKTFHPEGETKSKKETHHLDNSPGNNRDDNLIWVTHYENIQFKKNKSKIKTIIDGPF